MLTLPDFKQKQLLFIQTEHGVSNKIKFHNDNIVFTKDDKVINRASCHRVFAVFIVGDIAITSELIKQGLQYGVSFFFLKNNFELYASINSAAEGNYLLRMRQYSISDDEELFVAKKIVKNKIKNQLRLLKSRSIDGKYIMKENEIMEQIENAANQDSLRGIEGNVSKDFFSVYFKPIGWLRRMPRVKPDTENFLLDMGYTMIFNFVDALLRMYGFDTYKGCYHKLFFQRKSLACDIVEPFRSLIDRRTLTMHTLSQVDKNDFQVKNGKFSASFQNSQKYAHLFLETIMENREEIYKYTHGFYRFVMNNERNPFPEFKISR
ncbi:type V CRISPR-associated endonuclease Cas1 [Candidatus Wolfebacteria bacterium]|nr:type V CRISPR-associated endonuclease Cas1 [Candidatus Wolfebacteria bacterium]